MAELYNYVVPQGLIIPDTSVIQAQVTAEYISAFGADLITAPNSPAGLLITVETLARSAVANNNAVVANQINPFLAGGVFLDAILALTGIERVSAKYSRVAATIAGVPGTFIAAGSLAAENVNGAQFALTQDTTLPLSGFTSSVFQAVQPGAIPAAAGDLDQIISDVIGWETITNPDPAVLGAQAQSDAEARDFRRDTLFANGASLAGAIIANVSLVPGFNSMTFRENVADTTQVIDGVTMVSHSIYACISGGTDLDIATAMSEKKSGGCGYNNGASSFPINQLVVQPDTGQIINVKFDRPDRISCIALVDIRRGTAITPDLRTAVQSACYNYAQGIPSTVGTPGTPGALVVGANLSAFELAGAITAAIPGIYVGNVQVSKATPVSYTNVITATLWEQNYFANFSAITVTGI